jgi:hypothetical protein
VRANRTIRYGDVTRVVTPGVAQSLPAFRVPPNARCFVRSLPVNVGTVYIAQHPRPRAAALTPAGNSISLRFTDEQPVEIDADVLSQWFVDADTANDGVEAFITINEA